MEASACRRLTIEANRALGTNSDYDPDAYEIEKKSQYL
jgi:hypothetical protein